jgi:hypothetical protein
MRIYNAVLNRAQTNRDTSTYKIKHGAASRVAEIVSQQSVIFEKSDVATAFGTGNRTKRILQANTMQ